MSGWGTGLWGTGAWGGLDLLVTGASALALTDRSVQVEIPSTPLQESEIGDGDALNPLTWSVTSAGRQLTVLAVVRLNTVQFEIRTLELLDSWQHQVVVDAPTLRDSLGAVSPVTFTVLGCRQAPRSLGPTTDLVDLANPPFVGGGAGGSILVGAGGDYETETGRALLLKRVHRLLTTLPGELLGAPDYGIGLRVKEPLTVADVRELRLQIERALEAEPDVERAGARLRLADNALTVELRVLMSVGQSQALPSMTFPLGGVSS